MLAAIDNFALDAHSLSSFSSDTIERATRRPVLQVVNNKTTREIYYLRAWAIDVIKRVIPNWENIQIDTSNPNSIHFLGMSGGVDSSVLAACLALLFPEVNWKAIFCDTGDEPCSVPVLLDWIEELTGMSIARVHEDDLYERIEGNGYLPSPVTRWCTATLKIAPWSRYIKDNFIQSSEGSTPVFAYSGLRYDERDRIGIIGIKGVTTVHPFIAEDVAVDRQQVCEIGAELNLLNSSYYRGRSRSGCMSCPYQTAQEWLSLLTWHPKNFNKAASVEKMPQYLLDRFKVERDFCVKDKGFYNLYPMSAIVRDSKATLEVHNIFNGIERVDEEGRITWDYEPLVNKQSGRKRKSKPKVVKSSEDQLDMFGGMLIPEEQGVASTESSETSDEVNSNEVIVEQETTLFVAFEHYKSETMTMFSFGEDPLQSVWQSRLITYSTSKGGITRSLHGYYYHRAMSSSSAWRDIEHYDRESHITVVQISFPAGIIPKIHFDNIEEHHFGWAQGRCLAQMKYTVAWINRVCEVYCAKNIVSFAQRVGKRTKLVHDCMAVLDEYRQGGSPNIGTIVGLGHYRPKPLEQRTIDDSYDENIKTLKCFACSM